MKLQKGQRDKLEKYVNISEDIEVVMSIAGNAIYDYTCFGLDEDSKLSDDRYMVFYNQVESPDAEIQYTQIANGAKFLVNLSKLPQNISKLAFTVSIDGAGDMSMITNHIFQIKQNGQAVLEIKLTGDDFCNETAIISMEIYQKDVWRFSVTASGFNGGLGDLLRNYGGEEIEDETAATQQDAEVNNAVVSQTIPKLSLEKKLEQNAPKLISLAKPLTIELEKRNLSDCVARVALVLDISGSMSGRYKNGTVQEIVNKTLPLAVQFDDDGQLDFWYYGTTCRRMPSVTMKNYEKAVPEDWKQLMRTLGGSNNEVLVMEDIIKKYKGTKLPVYVLFITDGGVARAGAIKKILRNVSTESIFWQFVGVGGHNYGVLEQLDSLDGRYVDNANFFALDDFKEVGNPELYSRLLEEFPKWLNEIKLKGMI